MVSNVRWITDIKRAAVDTVIEPTKVPKDHPRAMPEACYGKVGASHQRRERINVNADKLSFGEQRPGALEKPGGPDTGSMTRRVFSCLRPLDHIPNNWGGV